MASSTSGKTQTAVVCHGGLDLRLEERDIPIPGPGEVQIQVGVSGLCGSDAHYYNHGANGIFKIREPLVLGHEAGGVITALGPDQPPSSTLKVGDRVAMEVGVSCKECKECRGGRYNLCPSMRFRSSAKTFPHLDGTMREYMTNPASLCFKLPDSVSMDVAALAEPLSVVLHAFRRAHLQPGSRILVLGAGAVGLLTCSLARASGATSVVAVDIEQPKLDFAAQMGWATGTYCLPKGPRVSAFEALDVAKTGWEGLKASEAVTSVLGLENGFDAVFECTGVESCMQLAPMAAVAGGKVLYVGMGTANLVLPTGVSLLREVDLIGVFRYCNTYPEAVALLGSGQLGDVGKMVSQRYSLDKAHEAFEDMKRGRDKQGNPVIKPMVGNLNVK